VGKAALVVLRASGEGDLNPFFMDELGGVAAVDTLVFSGREASTDPDRAGGGQGRRHDLHRRW
jgi:cyanophycinase